MRSSFGGLFCCSRYARSDVHAALLSGQSRRELISASIIIDSMLYPSFFTFERQHRVSAYAQVLYPRCRSQPSPIHIIFFYQSFSTHGLRSATSFSSVPSTFSRSYCSFKNCSVYLWEIARFPSLIDQIASQR